MAVRCEAKVTDVEPLAERAVLVSLAGSAELAAAAAGGQYIIVDTRTPKPDDPNKTIKRAYSLVNSCASTGLVQLAIREVAGGLGSPLMLALQPGTRVGLSGPYGSWTARDSDPKGPTLVVATDTGITAAIGLTSSDAFDSRRETTHVMWFVSSPDYMARRAWAEVRTGCTVTHVVVPLAEGGAAAPERLSAVENAVQGVYDAIEPASAYLVGDGAIIAGLASALSAWGIDAAHIACEYFFNNPRRSL